MESSTDTRTTEAAITRKNGLQTTKESEPDFTLPGLPRSTFRLSYFTIDPTLEIKLLLDDSPSPMEQSSKFRLFPIMVQLSSYLSETALLLHSLSRSPESVIRLRTLDSQRFKFTVHSLRKLFFTFTFLLQVPTDLDVPSTGTLPSPETHL